MLAFINIGLMKSNVDIFVSMVEVISCIVLVNIGDNFPESSIKFM